MEKYQTDQNEKEILQAIILEGWTDHLERSTPININQYEAPKIVAGSPKKTNLKLNLKLHQRIPEFLATAVIFLLLISIGATNIMIAKNNRTKAMTLGIATIVAPPTSSLTPSPTPLIAPKTEVISTPSPNSTSPEPADKVEPKMLTVTTGSSSESANIRQKPTTNSKIVGKAKDGDTFEMVSENPGWYEIKLPDGSTGFITSKYIKTEGANN